MIRKVSGRPAQSYDPSSGAASDEQRYIDAAEVRQIFPVTDMTLWRWVRDPRVAFPAPVKLCPNGRNFWWLPTIHEWERQRAARSTPRPVPGQHAGGST
jgi:predicted DNA-binding transcriptional regulator AlpA